MGKKDLVLITFSIADDRIRELRKEFPGYEFRSSMVKKEMVDLARSARIILTFNANHNVFSAAKNCAWIQTLNAGVEDFLTLEFIRNNDVLLVNSSGVHGIQISEHIFAMLLFLTRGIGPISRNQAKKAWIKHVGEEIESPYQELFGKTIVLAGIGSIGLEVAKRAKSFGMKTIALKRVPSKKLKLSDYSMYVDEIYGIDAIKKVASIADVIVNSLPLTFGTRGIFDKTVFSAVKKKPIFVNVGRGKTVVEKDLIAALANGSLSGACLDVFEIEPLPKDSPLWEMENVIVSPHVSGDTPRYYERAIEIFKDNLRRFSKGEPLRNVVDKNSGY